MKNKKRIRNPTMESDFGLFKSECEKTIDEFEKELADNPGSSFDDIVDLIEQRLPEQTYKAFLVKEPDDMTQEKQDEWMSIIQAKFQQKISSLLFTKKRLNQILLWQDAHLGAIILSFKDQFGEHGSLMKHVEKKPSFKDICVMLHIDTTAARRACDVYAFTKKYKKFLFSGVPLYLVHKWVRTYDVYLANNPEIAEKYSTDKKITRKKLKDWYRPKRKKSIRQKKRRNWKKKKHQLTKNPKLK